MKRASGIGRLAFALCVAGALAVGASQAVASPQQKTEGYGYCDNWPNQTACMNICSELGYPGGYCTSKYSDCVCREI